MASFEPLKLLNFDFNADPESAFISNADPISPNNADLDPQPCRGAQNITGKGSRRLRRCSAANLELICESIDRFTFLNSEFIPQKKNPT
jgi:hypothetical protein